MFAKYPGVRAYFSDGAFKGDMKVPPQVIRLGGAVTAFAKNIDNPEVLTDTIRKIGEAHVSRGVRSPHYPIVGECLLQAMKEILQYDGKEWGIAYAWLADVLINTEKDIRAKTKQAAGYEGFRQYTVDQMIEEEYSNATSIILKPGNFEVLKTRNAGGKFVCLAFHTPDEKYRSKITAYLSDVGDSDHLRVTVDQKAVAKLDITETVGVSPAFGGFDLEEVAKAKKNIVLLSAGLGIGRMFSILKSLAFLIQEESQKKGNEVDTKLIFIVAPDDGSKSKNFLLEPNVRKFEQENGFVTVNLLKEEVASVSADQLLEEVDGALDTSVGNATVMLSPTFKVASGRLNSKYSVNVLD